ncbi:MAG: putative sulfate exporter family transporter, partial [Christensenella sp.]
MKFLKKNMFGIILCLIIALPAFFLGKLLPVIGGPVFAILIGMVLALLIKNKEHVQTGVNFTSKKILQWAVVLLGFGMNLSEILRLGAQSLPIIVSTIATS